MCARSGSNQPAADGKKAGAIAKSVEVSVHVHGTCHTGSHNGKGMRSLAKSLPFPFVLPLHSSTQTSCLSGIERCNVEHQAFVNNCNECSRLDVDWSQAFMLGSMWRANAAGYRPSRGRFQRGLDPGSQQELAAAA